MAQLLRLLQALLPIKSEIIVQHVSRAPADLQILLHGSQFSMTFVLCSSQRQALAWHRQVQLHALSPVSPVLYLGSQRHDAQN